MKVTVLVAVYNAEKYLNACLDSLLAQSYTNLEIMCVDDCSTDSSLSILNDYAQKDNRIHVIHLDENQGQAKARNIAIKQSTGDLYCFLDSDDWFATDSIEKAVKVFESNKNADCVLFRLNKVYEDGKEEEYKMDCAFPLQGTDAFRKSLDWSIHGVYMVRASLQRDILYDDICRSYSDDNTTRLHYLRSREVDICEGTYYYRQNPQSVSHINNISRFNFLKANEHMQQMLRDMKMPDDILNLHEQVRMNNLIGSYLFYCQNRDKWSNTDRSFAQNELKRIWNTIEPKRLSSQTRFGYMLCPSWTLFKIQEETFYFLRKLLGR